MALSGENGSGSSRGKIKDEKCEFCSLPGILRAVSQTLYRSKKCNYLHFCCFFMAAMIPDST